MSKQLKTMKKMKTMKSIYYMALLVVCTLMTASCSNLDETLYDQVGTQNYYNTKNDVIRATFRPFEHAFWSIQSRHVLNELTADQLITPTRDGWWDDGKVHAGEQPPYDPNA